MSALVALDNCLAVIREEVRKEQQATEHRKAQIVLALAPLIAELRGSFVGRERAADIAFQLAGVVEDVEAL